MAQETALITGASSGIGRELARCFAADQKHVILTGRNAAALEDLAAELSGRHGIRAETLVVDLAQKDGPTRLHAAVTALGLPVDVLVNNAGFGLHGTFAELPLARQLEIVQVNITALVELTGLFLPAMVARGQGGILNVGSVAGFVPGPRMAVYYASKAFVLSFSEGLQEELRGTGVRVTNLCPGPTESNFSQVARSHRVRRAQATKMSAAVVAQVGYTDFCRGKLLSIPGVGNKVTIQAPRWLPRAAIRRLVGSYNKLT